MLLQCRQHTIARAAGLHSALVQNQKSVGHTHNARAVADQHHGFAFGFHALNRTHQSGFAFIVQVGIGFIEHHQRRLAVQRTGQANALTLTARQQTTRLAHGRVVAFGEPQNHLVQARRIGSGNDFLRHHLASPRNVLGNGAVKQLNVLWQVPNVRTQLHAVPIQNRLTVQHHLTGAVGPNA